MKIAIFSDVHANPWALQAALDWLDTYCPVDEVWHLGDLVGYGPDALGAIKIARQRFNLWIAGNHEEFWLNLAIQEENRHIDFQKNSFFALTEQVYHQNHGSTKKDAIDPLLRHLKELRADPESYAWLRKGLADSANHGPQLFQLGGLNLVLVHAAPSGPTEAYIYPWSDKNSIINYLFNVNENLLRYETPLSARLRPVDALFKSGAPYLVLFGNSHVPGVYHYKNGQVVPQLPPAYGKPIDVGKYPMAINPGSLGHPSDRDTRAAFAVLDVDNHQVAFYRVPYDIQPVINKLGYDIYPDAMMDEIKDALLRMSDTKKLGNFEADLDRLKNSPGY